MAAQWGDAVAFTRLGQTVADGNRHELAGFPSDAVTKQVEWVRTTAGPRCGDLEFQALVQAVIVTDGHRQPPRILVGPLLPLTPEEILGSPYLVIGSVDGIIETLLERRERWGFSHYTVRPASLAEFGPVVAALTRR